MTQHDPEAWLDLARQALAPRDTDRARVLSALEQRLELPSNDGPGELPSHGQELHSAHVASPQLALGVPSTLVRWALAAIVPVVGVAAVGMLLTTPAPRVPVLRPATQITAAGVEQSLPEVLDRTLAQVKEPSEPHPPEPAPPAPPTKPKKPARKKCRTAEGTPCPTVKPAETAVASAPPPPAAAPASSLSQELAALREAQRALREGQPARALAVLTSFEQEMEGPGAMQEERHAAATMARCALTPRVEARALYDEFMLRYPNSAYAARLQRTCLSKNVR